MSTSRTTPAGGASPWWCYPIVWMVIAGPAAVVVAGFATLAIAIAYPDPPVSVTPAATAAQMPAIQGRNHAAAPPGR
jgi:uncharacterized protein